jgi:hypothetical protein
MNFYNHRRIHINLHDCKEVLANIEEKNNSIPEVGRDVQSVVQLQR